MEVKTYSIENQTRESSVSAGVAVVNSTQEPLTALRVMVEGLGAAADTGLWLTHITVIPMVPRIAPFDLIYLDRDNRVIECVELLPASEIPRFKKPAASALVLPFHTISSARIEAGDQFSFNEILEQEDSPANQAAIEIPTVPAPIEAAVISVDAPAKPPEVFDSPFLEVFSRAEPGAGAHPVAIEITKSETAIDASDEEHFVLAQFLRGPGHAAEENAATADAAEPDEPVTHDPPGFPLRPSGSPAVPTVSLDRAEVSRPFATRLEQPRPVPTAEEKKPLVGRLFRWLYPALYDQNRRSSPRRPSDGLVAYESIENAQRMHKVGNVSSHGIYLQTAVRWDPGTVVALVVQRNEPFENNSLERVEFDVVAVREGFDGAGFSFAMPAGMEMKLWEAPGRNGANEADPGCILRELRMARALAFMRCICPPAAEQIAELFHKTLSNVRAAHMVEIALKAERLLMREPNAYCMVAHPDLTLRILEHGSWVDTEWLQELWAGLLATSCTLEGQDESNLVYIDILSRLAPLPTQILTLACAKAMQAMRESASVSPALFAFSAEEIARITRSNNLSKIYKSIVELSELGLVENSPKSSARTSPAGAKAKPTDLGLEMYARCQGIRGAA